MTIDGIFQVSLLGQGPCLVTLPGALGPVSFPFPSFGATIRWEKEGPLTTVAAGCNWERVDVLGLPLADRQCQGKAVTWGSNSPSVYERCGQSTEPRARELLWVLFTSSSYCC